MKITIIAVGKTKNKWLIEGENEFIKKLKIFADVEFKIVQEVGKCDKNQILKKESESILAKIRPQDFVCLLTAHGKELKSTEFAENLQKWETQSGGRISFVIGGSYGVSDEVVSRSNFQLSFSKMTMLHEMIRVFLLEQIYRGFCINSGKEYHKGK